MSYFIYTDLISSLLDLRLVDPGLTLIYCTLVHMAHSVLLCTRGLEAYAP